MDAAAVGIPGPKGWLAEQGFEVQVRALADQGDLEHEGLAERLKVSEFEHLLQVVFDTGQVQAEMRLVGGANTSICSFCRRGIGQECWPMGWFRGLPRAGACPGCATAVP